MYLVDTNVISASAPARFGAGELTIWMEVHSSDLYLSAVTVAEVEDGIAKARRTGATRKADNLAGWLKAVLHLYGDRVLAFDTEAARIAGALSDRARGLVQSPGLADVIIAATAERHGLAVLTRNLRHFEGLGIRALDPFLTLPD